MVGLLADRVREVNATTPTSGHFSEIASLALRRALLETVGTHGPSLFNSSLDDLQAAFRAHSAGAGFASVANGFFAEFVSRTLQTVYDRAFAQYVGPGQSFVGADDLLEYQQALQTYGRQAARVVEEFAADWAARHNWTSEYQIPRDEADRFVGQAFRKLRHYVRRAGKV